MSLNLALPARTEEQLRDLAQQQGVSTETYVTRLLEAHARQRDLDATTETQLLQRVDLGFTEGQWQRYATLVEHRREEHLTEAEHTELLTFIDQLEDANAERIAVLAELAKRRNLTLEKLMQELGLAPPGVSE